MIGELTSAFTAVTAIGVAWLLYRADKAQCDELREQLEYEIRKTQAS